VFWVKESLEKDFFIADKDGYIRFLNIANLVASIAVGQITSPLDLLGLLDLSKATALKGKIGASVSDRVAKDVSGK
jgi:hypothetical protein